MGERILVSERRVLGACMLTLALAVASWVLMRFGVFTLGRALGAVVLCIGALALHARRAGAREPLPPEPWRPLALALALCVAFGVLYAAFPVYFLLGGQDPGPYLAFSARVAKTGGINLFVPEVQRWVHAHGQGLLRSYPAVYGDVGATSGPDAPFPQFVHLYTAFTANFFSAARVEGAVRANAWLGALSLAAGFALLRRLGTVFVPFVFIVALGLNPAFIWASRITLTEVLALAVNLTGLLLLVFAWDRESKTFGVLAGAVLGVAVLNRLDGGVGGFAVLGFAVAASVDSPRRARIAAECALVHLAVCSFGYFDGRRLAPYYWRDLNRLGNGVVHHLIMLSSGLDVLALALALAPAWLKARLRYRESWLKFAGYAGIALLVLWIGYGLSLRHESGDPENSSAAVDLTWYVSWAAWPLYFIGLGVTLEPTRLKRWLPLWLFSFGSLVVFTVNTDVVHEHIWASRRWVPHLIPFLLAFAAVGGEHVGRLLHSRGKPLALGATALLAGYYLFIVLRFDRPFLFHTMMKGLPAAYEQIAEYARTQHNRWPLIASTTQVGSILTYVYDVPTVLTNENGDRLVPTGAFRGELGVGFDPFSLRNAAAVDPNYVGKYLDRTSKAPPSRLYDARVPLEIGVFGPTTFDISVPASHRSLHTRATRVSASGALVSKGREAAILWGPWMDLAVGRYRVEYYGSAQPKAEEPAERGSLNVIADKGKTVIAEMPLTATEEPAVRLLGGLDFQLAAQRTDVEFRVNVEEHSGVTLTYVRLMRFGS